MEEKGTVTRRAIDRLEEADPAYYATHADQLGWGPGQHALSGSRTDALVRYATGATFLDLGCGAGRYVDFLARQGCQATGVDFTAFFLSQAISEGLGGRFVCADILHLPFADRSFDTVSMFTVIEHIGDDRAAVCEAARMARRRLIIMVPLAEDEILLRSGLCLKNRLDGSHLHYYSAQGVTALLESVGCRIVDQYFVNVVALRYLVSQCLRLPAAAVWIIRAFLRVLPWKYYYNECITIADVAQS